MTDASPSPASGLAARRGAIAILGDVLDRKHNLSDAFERAQAGGELAGLDRRDRAFARAIVYCVLRRKNEIDHILSRFLSRPLPARSGTTHAILLTGTAQLIFLEIAPHAVIDVSVKLAATDRLARHFKGLVNAVLRRVSELTGRDIQTIDSVNTPDWLLERWRMTYGDDVAGRIAKSHLAEPPLDLAVKSEPEKWAQRLGGVVLPTGQVRLANAGQVDALPGYHEGAWWVQDAAAHLPAKLLGPVAGKIVFDLCAAPGGKTAQLALAGAQVHAVDISKHRLKVLRDNLKRLGLSAKIICADARLYRPGIKADAVIIDAPCSATGTIRRNPDIKYLKRPADISSLARLQTELLHHAVELIKPGGRVIYSTCSLESEEGIDQINAVASARLAQRQPLTPADVFGLSHLLSDVGDLRTLPFMQPGSGTSGGMDGFFAARLTAE